MVLCPQGRERMRIFRRLKDYLINSDVDIQDRQYVLTVCIGIASILAAVLFGILIGENVSSLLFAGGGGIVFSTFTWICYKIKKLNVSAIIIAGILVFFFEPVNFFTSGGIHGGAALWFAFAIVYITLVLRGKWRSVFVVLEVASVLITYGFAYQFPGIVEEHDEATAFADSLVSLILVSILLCCMIYFQTWLLAMESKRAKEQAEQIDRINHSQKRFFSNISHEIRTPINTIIGLNEMILREENISKEVEEDSVSIRSASGMLLTLINDILDLSKLESGKLELSDSPFSVRDLLSEIHGMIDVRAREKNLLFDISVDPEFPRGLMGDDVRIKQILINLLNNSVKYTPEGRVELVIGFLKIDDDTIRAVYEVRDTGLGIPEESIPHLFDAFMRVDNDKNKYIEGTGLGLSIVKQLVDAMGGRIEVESEVGKGSMFRVTLDQKVTDPVRIGLFKPGVPSITPEVKGRNKLFEAPDASILIVDDNKINLTVVSKLLMDTKLKITTASSGEECLKLTASEAFDAILMDHLMPGMDGIECFHAIREQEKGANNETPVIILTANAGSDYQNMYIEEGFNDYVLKPVKSALLEKALVNVLPDSKVRLM